jgi:hypothetical protein
MSYVHVRFQHTSTDTTLYEREVPQIIFVIHLHTGTTYITTKRMNCYTNRFFFYLWRCVFIPVYIFRKYIYLYIALDKSGWVPLLVNAEAVTRVLVLCVL